MTIKEDKKKAKNTLIITLMLFVASAVAFSYGQGGAAVFAMIVSGVSAVFCVRKITKDGYLQISDDGFCIKNGANEGWFYFKDISDLGIRSIGEKQKAQILSVEFKKNRLNRDAAYLIAQPVGDSEIIIYNRYEKDHFEIARLLKDALESFKKAR